MLNVCKLVSFIKPKLKAMDVNSLISTRKMIVTNWDRRVKTSSLILLSLSFISN